MSLPPRVLFLASLFASILILSIAACSPAPNAPSAPASDRAASASLAIANPVPGSTPTTDLASCLAARTASCFVTSSRDSAQGASLLAAPTNLIAQLVNQADVFLSWNPPSTAGTVSYLIEAGSAPGLANLASVPSNSGPRFQANNVPPGTYYVRVRAVDASGAAGPPSNEVTITIGSCLGATGLFAAVNNGGTVTLQWQPGNGVTSYVLEAGTAPGLSNIASVPVGNTTSFTANGVPNGTYFVRVRANSTCGAVPPSNELRLVVGQLGK